MFIFDRCHHSSAAVTLVKNECDSNILTGTLARFAYGEINERSFSNPHPRSVYESKFMACRDLISSGSLFCVFSMSEIPKPRQLVEQRSTDVRNCIRQRTLDALIVRIFNCKLGSQKKTCQSMRFSSEEMVSFRDKITAFDMKIIIYEFSLISCERTYFRRC